jgi:UDP-3-O-[3-hydroxymyristoyl] glucosamine N-acyltransferase
LDTVSTLIEHLEGAGHTCVVEGDTTVSIHAVNTLEDAGTGEISFLANPRYEKALSATRASAVIVPSECAISPVTAIRTRDPYAAITAVIVKVHGMRAHPRFDAGDRVSVAPSARIGEDANIAPHVTIAENVTIGKRVTIYPGCYIATNCRLGDDVVLYPNVVLYDRTVVGHRVTVHAGTVLGEDGLGYAPIDGKWEKIPQVGHVEVADDVEIGANCAIDRATLGRTIIGRGSKFSNLVAVGHGTKIGEDCLLVAQVGLAGSVTVGRHVTMAGQAGIVGHVTIGDNATVGAKAGVTHDVPAGVTVLGQPAVPINECKRQIAVVQNLPDMRKQIKILKKQFKTVEQELAKLKESIPPCPSDSD